MRLQGIDDFALLELEDSAGGNSRGGMVNGIACPLGAHYLPLPSDDAPEVQNLLEELGLRKRVAGRWEYDERHLCHSPQERLFFNGEWQDGLLPVQGVGQETLAQYAQFAALVEQTRKAARWTIPVSNRPLAPVQIAQAALTFIAYLEANGLTDPHLRWYLDYCCRDDYGAGIATVSAWAGLHYFVSRHGFHAPGLETAEREGLLTWPESNAWLTLRLAAPLQERLHTGQVVLRIANVKHGVEVDTFNTTTQTVERWQAWRDEILAELSQAHPDLPLKTTRIDLSRYGHAMAIPVPKNLSEKGLQPTQNMRKQLSNSEHSAITHGSLRFAHSDWAGYSVFEEAFTLGHAAGAG